MTLDSLPKVLAGKRVLVTGANSFIGRRVLRLEESLQVELHAVCRRPEELNAEHVHRADMLDTAAVAKVVADVRPEIILHLAAAGVSYNSGTLPELVAVNVTGFSALLEAASKLPTPPTVVAAGSGFEYTPQNRLLREEDPTLPQNNYGISKVAAAAIASSFAQRMPLTILRLFSIYGPGEPAARLTPYVAAQIQRGQTVELTPCEQIRDYTHVDDLAEAFFRAAASPPTDGRLRILNTASGQTCTLRLFVEQLASALHRKGGHHADLRFGAKPYRPDEMMYYAPNIATLRQTLGWAPPTSLEEGVNRFIEEIT